MGGIPAVNGRGERLLLHIGIIDILQSYRWVPTPSFTFPLHREPGQGQVRAGMGQDGGTICGALLCAKCWAKESKTETLHGWES